MVNCGCSEGTLSCSSEDKPIICDFTSSYFLNNNKDGCEKKTIAGCEIINPNNLNSQNCLLCKKNYVFDSEKTKCIEVSEMNSKENCERYDPNDSSCIECLKDFYLNSGNCVAVGSTKIENCSIYSSSTVCQKCDEGYYLKDQTCSKLTIISNCHSYTVNKCDQCQSDYILDTSLNTSQIIDNVLLNSIALENQNSSIVNSVNSQSVCLKHDVKNCQKFETFGKCQVCETNYMLTNTYQCLYSPEDPIENCVIYSAGDTCIQCEDDFYVKNKSCHARTADVNCKTWSINDDKCLLCESTHYLTSISNDTKTLCVIRNPSPYQSCLTVEIDQNICIECIHDHSKSLDFKACFPDLINCENQTQANVFSDSKHVCTKCFKGYTLLNDACSGTPVQNCKTYTPDTSTCTECNSGFYLDTNNCLPQNVTGCVAGNYVDNENQCTKCESLKKPLSTTNPNQCSTISNSNCASSNGLDDNCTSCLSNYKLEGTTCVNQRTISPANCISNISNLDDTACESCHADYHRVTGFKPYASDAELSAMNCLAISNSTSLCTQCIDNYFLNENSICEDKTSESLSNICVRKTISAGPNSLLSDNTDCEVCNSSLGLVSVNNTCELLSISNLFNCYLKGTSESSACDICSSGNSLISSDLYTCGVDSTNGNISFINDCLVHNALGKCYKCSGTKIPNSDGLVCEERSAKFIENTFDWIGSPMGSMNRTLNDVSQCELYGQVNPSRMACIKCLDNHVGIVSTITNYYHSTTGTNQTNFANLYYNGITGKSDFSVYNGFTHCIPDADVAGNANKFTGTNCAIGILFAVPNAGSAPYDSTEVASMDQKYACIQCDAGNIGTLGTISQSSNGTSFANNFIHIKSCEASANMDNSNGIGFGYTKRFETNQVSWNNFFSYSTCTSGTKTVVYSMKRKINDSLPFEFTETSTKSIQCADDTDLTYNIFTSNKRLCAAAVYQSGFTPVATISSSDQVNVECIACKSGYIADVDSNGFIKTCQIINNCDSTGPNIFLDTCGTNNNPYYSTANGDYLEINFNILHLTPITNCQVVDLQGKCVMCNPTFQPNPEGDGCIQLNTTNTDCDSTGSGVGQVKLKAPIMGFSDNALSNETKQFMTFMQIRTRDDSFISNYAGNNSLICKGNCSNGTMFKLESQTERRICGKNVSSSDYGNVNNCIKENALASGCQQCEDNYIPNIDQNKCVLKSSKPGCATVKGTGNDCETCLSGFIKSGNTCVETFCKEHDSNGKCLVCTDNAKRDPDDDQKCLSPDSVDASCLNFHAKFDNYCVKCKQSTQIPYVIKKGLVYTFTCEDWTKGNAELGYVSPYTYVLHEVSSGSNVVTLFSKLKMVEISSWENREYSKFTDGGKTGEHNCMRKRTISNCKLSGYIDNMYCAECEDKFWLNSTQNKCELNTVQNCKISQKNEDTCVTCEDNYFLENPTSCKDRTKSLDCLINDRDPNSDECSACNNIEKWFKDSDKTCNNYTAKYCLGYLSNSDTCELCEDGSYAVGSGNGLVCKIIEIVENCELYSTNENKCLECKQGYWLDKTTDPSAFTCKKRTNIEFCSTYDEKSDECRICSQNRYFHVEKKECRDYPKGTVNCEIYSYPSTCTQCKSGYFVDGSICSEVTTAVPGCKIHSSATECGTCLDTYIANGENCDKILIITGCEEYSDKNSCSKCDKNYFLENDSCTSSGIVGCIEAVKGSPNVCNICEEGRYLNSTKRNCLLGNTVSGCADYKDENTCNKCESGKILNHDGTKCEDLTNQAGSNCSIASTLDDPVCDTCNFGYKKTSEGKCKSINNSNCLVEDIYQKCILCNPKTSWMNKDGYCTIVSEPECVNNCSQNIFQTSIIMIVFFFILKLF